MERILNMTPHPVILLDGNGCEYNPRTRSYSLVGEPTELRVFEPVGDTPIRCSTSEVQMDPIDGVPTLGITFGEIEGLPEEREGVYMIVSAIVANAGRSQGRRDLLVPAHLVRNADGNIVGCLALARE